jgi:hypothetical protein
MALSTVPAFGQGAPPPLSSQTYSIADSKSSPIMGIDLTRFVTQRTLTILAVGGIAATMSRDRESASGMQQALEGSSFEPVLDFGDKYGSGWVVGSSSLALLAAGTVSGQAGMASFGADLCSSYLVSGAAAFAIKFSVNRRRPSGGGLSFPSGHTTAAFSTVPVIAHHLGWQAGAVAAFVAASTGMGRMEDRHHYLSDVLFGAAIGLAVGDAVIQNRMANNLLAGVTVAPDRVGYTIRF